MLASIRPRWLVAAFVIGAVTGYTVAGRRYELHQVGGITLRLDRSTGATRVLDADNGWRDIPDPPPAYRQGWKLVRDSTLTAGPAAP